MKAAGEPLRRARGLAAWGAALAMPLLAGCWQYEIGVTIYPDGSGSRTLRLQANPDDLQEESADTADFIRLFNLSTEAGWTMERQREPGAQQEILIFTRRSQPASLGDWRHLSGDVRIQGTLEPGPNEAVAFTNVISIEAGAGANLRTYTYREQFTWTGLREIIIARQAEGFFNRLHSSYPFLSGEDRLELTGLLAGAMLATVELEASSKEPEGVAEALGHAVEAHVKDVIRRHDPGAACTDVGQIAKDALTGADKDLEAFLHEKLPGAYLAGATSIELRVMMPGRIVDTNADRVEDRTACWSLDAWDALVRPVEPYARSELSE